MAWKTRLTLFWLFAGLVAWPHEGLAARGQQTENPREICMTAAHEVERKAGIPHDLLAAIALSESGRYDAETKENFAWPWTVTAEGKGRYFSNEKQARAEVEMLLSQGVKNIDVGCMQVNLYYHWNAFETLADAFDPVKNAAYAAKFLKSNYADSKDWLTAAGHYHSQTPENYRPYRIRVLSHWNRLKSDEAKVQLADRAADPAAALTAKEAVADDAEKEREVSIVGIDVARTAALNNVLRDKRQAARLDMSELDRGNRRLSQLDRWRTSRNQGVHLEAVVAERLAEMQVRQQQRLRQLDTHDHTENFAARRQQQLARWRNTGSLISDTVSGVEQ